MRRWRRSRVARSRNTSGRSVRDVHPVLADKIEPAMLRVIETGEATFGEELSGELPAASRADCATFGSDGIRCVIPAERSSAAGELLATGDDAEFRRLLDRIRGVAAGVRHADDLGLGSLRLQQERGEVRRIQRMLDGADAPCRPTSPRPPWCRARARGRTRSPRSGSTRCRRRPSPAPARCVLASM